MLDKSLRLCYNGGTKTKERYNMTEFEIIKHALERIGISVDVQSFGQFGSCISIDSGFASISMDFSGSGELTDISADAEIPLVH
jgi:hypothetical protein